MVRQLVSSAVLSLRQWVLRVLAILFTPASFAAGLDTDSVADLKAAARFYVQTCLASTAVWIYLIYFLGGISIADVLFPGSPDKARILYVSLAVIWTVLPALAAYAALKIGNRKEVRFFLFVQLLAYAAGAILIVIALIAAATAAFALWRPINPDQVTLYRTTLLEAADQPALCDKIHSIECQVALRLGANAYPVIGLTLATVVAYQVIILLVMTKARLNIKVANPLIVTFAILLAGGYVLSWALELLGGAIALKDLPGGSRIQQAIAFNRCQSALARNDLSQAQGLCEDAARLNNDYASAHIKLCLARGLLASYEGPGGALAACNRAVELSGKSAVAYLMRGATYSVMKQFGRAVDDFTRSTQFPLARYMRGEAFRELRRFEEAAEEFDAALKGGINNAKLHVSYAKCHMMLNKLDLAQRALKQAEKLDKSDSEIYVTWSSIHNAGKNLDKAAAALDRAVALNPRSASAYRARCAIFATRDHQEALRACNKVLELEPEVATNYLYRARVHRLMQRTHLAEANHLAGLHLLEMRIVEQRESESYKSDLLNAAKDLGNLSFAAVLAGKHQRALEAADDALRMASDQLWIKMNRAHALAFLGRLAEARSLYLQLREESWGGRSWKDMLEEDFSWLRSAVRVSDGIGDLFAEIEDALKIREKGKRTSPPPFP